MTTLKASLARDNQRLFYFEQLVVKSAFVNGELKDDVHLRPPEGDNIKSAYVYKLKKASYGLKEAAKLKYLDNKRQLADMFIKGLSKVIFRNCAATLSLEYFTDEEC
ncbi:hypothetical protein ILUMI_22620 [Ignelater luminosus]|uniref:Reverse transcriptase Ty1/copia-type domain-containing protein n=1 Tax=Ignelater luminosus TaxID=2038154 RepID=A0A8K0CE40_IGNLU|nr:hypothetical protein ILUMI_22620 [Ignelater luminosus]